ncbi:hypothetical protein CSV71_13630 [Sporosarcina sp. P21c]|uniref:hypothetical protein n=1 Tax=Sporosarcina sp. P25 TaxID=2048254 RepID=UPI000A155D38|nr:hypothetical protein [Sporosarcina sp. P25]ARJ39086.1 hypothetical protein SporoP8_09485 [Sporosarcina ureae]PIC66254.1 hypothetical protein CSV78_13230 [Sporosarcina sp. P16a]PIC82230.1 hypothetical protein CSV73_13210 [Sporosarcina sp. P1]PIC88723.1 hypothetical protein CSV71_13630 [Sporosarcina sp. P21c]PIC91918.1 hypothetical protein CSV70_12905 [Sporosarcina sp. P25]
MPAYIVNEYYVFTSYEDLSSLIFDIIHYSLLPVQQDRHSFSILTGHLDIIRLKFQCDNGLCINVRYESEDDIYYSV